jgi:hypothetical protein
VTVGLTEVDTETEITGTFTISPYRYNIREVTFTLEGTGKVNYSGAYVSYFNDFNQYLKDNSKTDVSVSPISGTKEFEFKGTSYGTLVPKVKTQ